MPNEMTHILPEESLNLVLVRDRINYTRIVVIENILKMNVQKEKNLIASSKDTISSMRIQKYFSHGSMVLN